MEQIKRVWNHSDCFGFDPFDYTNTSMRWDYSAGTHSHSFYEINVIMHGTGLHTIGAQVVPVKEGSVFVIPPGIEHSYTDTDHLDIYHILIADAFMNRYREELKGLSGYHLLFEITPMLQHHTEDAEFLSMTEHQMKQIQPLIQFTLDNTGEGVHIISCAQVLSIIGLLCRFAGQNHRVSAIKGGSNYLSLIIDSLEYLHIHYNEKISVDDLAEHCHLSRSTFIRNFQSICRTTPGNYLLRYRIKKAKEQILSSDNSLSVIAEQCGFYDQSHFTKSFQRLEGFSPNRLREKL